MPPTFIAVYEDNIIKTYDTLEVLKSVKDIKYVFKKELHEIIKNKIANAWHKEFYKFKYTLINRDGSNRTLRKGHFELIDIGPDNRYYATFEGRELKVFDHVTSSVRLIISKVETPKFITTELLPLLDLLEKINDWHIYEELVEAKGLKAKMEKFKATIESQKIKIEELEGKLTRIKNFIADEVGGGA